jgi:hypothetical protein
MRECKSMPSPNRVLICLSIIAVTSGLALETSEKKRGTSESKSIPSATRIPARTSRAFTGFSPQA